MNETLTVVITGAGSTVGQAVVERLLTDDNVQVIATSRRRSLPEQTSRLFCYPGVELTDDMSVTQFAGEVQRLTHGALHVVNCTGFFPGFLRITESDISVARHVYESNFLSVFGVARYLLPLIVRGGGGHFIAFSSHAVYQAYPLMAAFTSSKVAIETLIRSIAHEHSADRIVATAIAPATIDCEYERSMAPNGDFENWLKPADVAEVVAGLLGGRTTIANGNVLQLYRHSDSYFAQSYFDRIGRGLR